MARQPVSGLWVRKVPANNFLNIERRPSSGPAGGGGALYIEAPSSVVPALLALLGRDPTAGITHEFAVDTGAIGTPSASEPLIWNTKTGNRMRLFQNRQSDPSRRHPAWRSDRGFPKAPDSITSTEEAGKYISEGLRIYVVRVADGEYFAGFLVGGYPADWPDDDGLRTLFEGPGGVKEFTSGLYLAPDDRVRPFRTDTAPSVVAAGGVMDADAGEDSAALDSGAASASGYASPDIAAAVDRIAMDLAVEWAEREFAAATVVRMPHNNPGYDLLLTGASGVIGYVEVKGTTLASPRFFLSEVERHFSEVNSEIYTLVVFYGIDLDAETGNRIDRRGAILETDLGLRVMQWQGVVPVPDQS